MQVALAEPVPPSRLVAKVPADLETICLKCLEKSPRKLYGSAAELSDDLGRFRTGEPIAARPVSRWERGAKWVKRNRGLSAGIAAAVLALLVGTAVSMWQAIAARSAAASESQQRQAADAARQTAQVEKKRAEGLADDFRGQKELAEEKEREALKEADKANKTRDFLVSIFKFSDANAPSGTVTARQILDDAERRIPKEFADQPELQAELLAAIAEIHRNIGTTTPVAMILALRGSVQLQSAVGLKRQAAANALLYAGDRLTLAADAHVQLVSLSDLHKERLKPSSEATVLRNGCKPADAIAEKVDDILMTFIPLPKGTFYMGWGYSVAKKGIKTEIKEDFEIAVHTVTQGQWQAIMGKNPSDFSRLGMASKQVRDISDEELKLFPVESVSWDEAQEFIKKVNEQYRGRGWLYRLPTEVEWEYACRCGSSSAADCAFYFYLDKPTNNLSSDMANFNGNSPSGTALKGKWVHRPTRVGAYPPNKFRPPDVGPRTPAYSWLSCQ